MTATIVYDDARGLLAPLTDLRAAFDVRTGALTTLERLSRMHDVDVVGVRSGTRLHAITRERHGDLVDAPKRGAGEAADGVVRVINGRCPVPPGTLAALSPGQALVEEIDGVEGDLIGALVPRDRVERVIEALMGDRDEADSARGVLEGLEIVREPGRWLMSRPWHVRTFRDRALAMDIDLLLGGRSMEPPFGTLGLGEAPMWVEPTAIVYPGVTLDMEHGPIVIRDHAVVRPGAMLIGPCVVGEHSTVLERATIRAGTAIGPWCKVNGEIGGTIFQGFANKAHDGYLGDSFVGEWVNLGAGTTNSNLLNTYGEVISRATPEGRNERTGEQFLGAILGDHVKTAICSRLMTGCIVGTGSMLATTSPASGCMPAFTWATDATGTTQAQHRTYRFEKFLDVARAAMARRKVQASSAYIEAMRAISDRG